MSAGEILVAHLSCESLAERIEILRSVTDVAHAAGVTDWFFGDVSLPSGVPALEMVVLDHTTDFRERFSGATALEDTTSGRAHGSHSYLLGQELFWGTPAPRSLGLAHSVLSRRAATLIEAASTAGLLLVPYRAVEAEVASAYRWMYHDPVARAAVIAEHVAWLRRTGATDALVAQEDADVELHAELPSDYGAFAEHIANATAELSGDPGRKPSPETLEIALFARLVHTQVVRLRGPNDPAAKARELSFLAALAAAT